MGKLKTVCIDVDGVLADFIEAFTRQGKALYPDSPIEVVSSLEHQYWDEYPGMSVPHIQNTWAYTANHPREFFVHQCKALITDHEKSILAKLLKTANVYFVTARSVPHARHVTQEWISRLFIGIPELVEPHEISVVCTKKKGDFARVVNADYAIDDKAENADCVVWLSEGRTKSYILDRPYNAGEHKPHSHKVRRVPSFAHFLADVQEGK